MWGETPKRVLLLGKPMAWAPELLPQILEAARTLSEDYGMHVLVEPDGQLHVVSRHLTSFCENYTAAPPPPPHHLTTSPPHHLTTPSPHYPITPSTPVWYNGRTLEPSLIQSLGIWNYNADDWQSVGGAPSEPPPVDMVVTIGGDGLLMHVNTIFPGAAPPILSLSGGSLGFLAPFEVLPTY